MKKILVMAAILVSAMSVAQDDVTTKATAQPVKFGLKLGLNIASLTDFEDVGSDTKSRTGVNIGAYVHYKFSNKFAFQPEVLYTTQGAIQEGVSEGINLKITYKLDYIAVPLMIKYYPTKNFNVEFGPQLAFNVKKELEGKGNGETVTWDIDRFFEINNLEVKTNTFDLGLNFGLGYELDNGMNFGARYSLGLIKVFEGSDVVSSSGSAQNIKNSVFSFGVGYTFN